MRQQALNEPVLIQAAYEEAFRIWSSEVRRAGRVASHAALGVYEDMWLALGHYMAEPGRCVAPGDLSQADLEAFVLSRAGRHEDAASPKYVWRLLQLIDRVSASYARDSLRPSNTAALDLLATRREWLYANARRGEIPEYLAPARAKHLVEVLSAARPRPGRPKGIGPWQELRNKASVGLQLGAGVTPAEVRELKLSSLVSTDGVPWKLRVSGANNDPVRETPVATWAGQLVKHWLEVRDTLQIPGDWLFPSTRKGSHWTKPAQYLAAKAVFTAAGWSPEEATGGSFRLRHTFAIRQLRRGIEELKVAQWLGIEPEAMERYNRVLLDPVDAA